MKRKIIEINEELCNGCGQCVLDCAEGAIKIIDGKAKLISDNLCDGLGACMGSCPQDALKITEREAQAFDEEAVVKHLNEKSAPVCKSLSMTMAKNAHKSGRNWPVQISLVSADSDIFENQDILIAADCAGFACKDFHDKILKNKKLLIGCPKLDNSDYYIDKFTEIFKKHNLKSLSLARMEVPCCSKMENILNQAVKRSGRQFEIEVIIVSVNGDIKK